MVEYAARSTLQHRSCVRHALEAVEFIADNGGGVGCDFVRQGGNDRGNELIYPPNSQGAADQKLSGQRRAA